MIKTIQHLDKKTAAGILARTALSLESDLVNPDSQTIIADEENLRTQLISELKNSLGLRPDDQTPESIYAICDALDLEVDKLLGSVDELEALKRVSDKGELPSDQFEINIIPNVSNFYEKHYSEELPRIIETIKRPQKEQQFGKPHLENQPFLVSLFARYYRSKFPSRDFLMLVAGQRAGLKLDVHHVWRVYPALVPFNDSDELVTILEKFANVFGIILNMGNQKGSFILTAKMPEGVKEISFTSEFVGPNTEVTCTYFVQPDPITGNQLSSLITGINLTKYRKTIEKMGWKIIPPTKK